MVRRTNIRFVLAAIMAISVALLLPKLSIAGDLEPSGPPGPTMHTLDDIYTLILNQKQGLPKTGQTTSFATGDDGDLRMGVSWPYPRFTNHGDGTVTDNLTGIMWTQNSQQIEGLRDWFQAVVECNSSSFANHDDWRLPNIRELDSLIDYSTVAPALPPGHPFLNVLSADYWSSTTTNYQPDHAWNVYMWSGYVDPNPKTQTRYVWCARGGL